MKKTQFSHPIAPAPTRNMLSFPSLVCTSVPYTAICPSYLHPRGVTAEAGRGWGGVREGARGGVRMEENMRRSNVRNNEDR